MKITKKFRYGKHEVVLETGRIARQATGAVMVTMDNLSVLATVVADSKQAKQDFFPLSVHYQEKLYATGKIPGGFFRREGRPTEKETLTSRLIDRPLRPLFVKEFQNEVQVICTVMSADEDLDPDVAAMIGASAALAVSGIPWHGPIGCARVGYDGSQYLLNPGFAELEQSKLNMVVAGTTEAVLMVESEAGQLSEEIMLGAVMFAHEQMQEVLRQINELAQEAGRPPLQWTPLPRDESLGERLKTEMGSALEEAYSLRDKKERREKIARLRQEACASYLEGGADRSPEQFKAAFSGVEKQLVRNRILDKKERIDGRDPSTVRDIEIETGLLPKVHGSALFTRGETQAIVSCTLGTMRDAQMIETLRGEHKHYFMLHYNFPPYSVGECGRMLGASRREIGHGYLARRAVTAVLPEDQEKTFPYTVRVVSEISESNGSSSMATVCGASLAMMDAGMPVSAPVAGVAMGLIKEGDRFVVLTDILGDEDHLGDMDFKVAGTAQGVTALQMDIKINGITKDIMQVALEQACSARGHILEKMNAVIGAPRSELPEHAPSVETVQISVAKIRDVIGKGGAMIRSIQEETGATVEVDPDGLVRIYGDDRNATRAAAEKVREVTAGAEVGQVYEGTVETIKDFGAFVSILPGKQGLVHISQIANHRVEKVTDVLREGQQVRVKVIEVNPDGKIRLSMKAVSGEEALPA